MFQLNNITLKGSSRARLQDVTLEIPFGRTAIVGFSGAGKTSLLNVLAEFELPDSGTVNRRGRTRESVSGEFGQVGIGMCRETNSSPGRLPFFWAPQNGGLWPHLTVQQHLKCMHDSESADNLLQWLDLEHRQTAVPSELSMGERSRLAVARALASRAEILLLDEPLSHVDPVRKPEFWSVLRKRLEEESISMVFASHEPETVLRHAERVVCLQNGRVAFAGSTDALYHSPPSREVGEFLGPLNWFEPEEAAHFAVNKDAAPRAISIRPEFLQLQQDADSEIELLSMPYRAGTAESVVRHLPSGRIRTVLHQSGCDLPLVGQRVRLAAGARG